MPVTSINLEEDCKRIYHWLNMHLAMTVNSKDWHDI